MGALDGKRHLLQRLSLPACNPRIDAPVRIVPGGEDPAGRVNFSR
jgi:hypothetical protein